MDSVDELFSLSEVDEEDVNQEAEVLKLLGKKPNKNLIRKKLWGQRQLCIGYSEEIQEEEFEWFSFNPDPQIVEDLASWSLKQSKEIRDQVLEFLDDPTNEKVDHLINELIDLSIITRSVVSQRKEISLGKIILEELNREPRTIEELYSLRSIFLSERPEAAIRQAVRRLISKGDITNDHGLLTPAVHH